MPWTAQAFSRQLDVVKGRGFSDHPHCCPPWTSRSFYVSGLISAVLFSFIISCSRSTYGKGICPWPLQKHPIAPSLAWQTGVRAQCQVRNHLLTQCIKGPARATPPQLIFTSRDLSLYSLTVLPDFTKQSTGGYISDQPPQGVIFRLLRLVAVCFLVCKPPTLVTSNSLSLPACFYAFHPWIRLNPSLLLTL